MTKTSRARPVNQSPILLVSMKTSKTSLEKNKMIRMSLKKLKKIGDPETLLSRAVLINNTLECLRNTGSSKANLSKGETCHNNNKKDTYAQSAYSTEEEQVLNRIQIPCDLTHLTGDMVNINDGVSEQSDEQDSVVDQLLRTLPGSTSVKIYGKSEIIDKDNLINIEKSSQVVMPSRTISYNSCNNMQCIIAA